MSRHKTKDKDKVIADLNQYLARVSISISYDGGILFDGVITCEISSTDTTQHSMFTLAVSIEDECPIAPHTLTITEVGDFARSHMRTKGIDLSVEKYNLWVVSPLQIDVAKPGAANAKYRRVPFVCAQMWY